MGLPRGLIITIFVLAVAVDLSHSAGPTFTKCVNVTLRDNQTTLDFTPVTATGATAYSMTYQSVNQSLFILNKTTGAIKVSTNDIDNFKKTSFRLAITATGRDGSSDCNVYINIVDINDNAPVFSKPIYNVTLTHSLSPGDVFVRVLATDKDLTSANNEITYSLGGKYKNYFAIGAKTGIITFTGWNSTGRSRREGFPDGQFSLEVGATDNGSPQLSGHGQVTTNNIYCLGLNCNFNFDNNHGIKTGGHGTRLSMNKILSFGAVLTCLIFEVGISRPL